MRRPPARPAGIWNCFARVAMRRDVGWLPMTPTKAKAPAPRIVSVWFPMLTMERWRRVIAQYRSVPGDEVPVVLSRDGTMETMAAARVDGRVVLVTDSPG